MIATDYIFGRKKSEFSQSNLFLDSNPATLCYSLERLKGTFTDYILRISKMPNFQDEAFLYFDQNNLVSLLSPLTDTSNARLPKGTLGEWIQGTGIYAVADGWREQASNAFHIFKDVNSLERPILTTDAKEVYTENGRPALYFNGNATMETYYGIPALNSGNNFTIYTVSANHVNNDVGVILNTTDSNSDRFAMFRDRRTGTINRNSFIQIGAPVFAADLSQVRNIPQLLQTTKIENRKVSSWDNTIPGGQNITITGDYLNSNLRLGAQHGKLTKLKGTIQEIIIRPQADNAIHREIFENNINSRYNIYT